MFPYDGNDADANVNVAPATATVTIGEDYVVEACALTKEGYVFIGWDEDAQATTATYVPTDSEKQTIASVSKNYTLYAIWREEESKPTLYNVTYHSGYDESEYVEETAGSYTVKTYEATNLDTPDGYAFQGWATEAQGSVVYAASACTAGTASMQLTRNVHLYAIWVADSTNDVPETYTVTYLSNGGSGSMVDADSPYSKNTVVLIQNNVFSRNGYTFKGFVMQDGDGTLYASAGDATSGAVDRFAISEDITLVAQWKKNSSGGGATSYSVRYDANGGTGSIRILACW